MMRRSSLFICLCSFSGLALRLGALVAAPPASASPPTTPDLPEELPLTLPAIPDLKTRLETLEQRLAKGQAPADPQNLALFRFKLERSRLLLGILERDEAVSPTVAQRALAADVARASAISHALGDAVAPTNSQMHERAYLAADGSAQPYWVFLPKDYSAQRAYPLVVFLHGYDPYISKVDPWIPGEQTWSLATNRGFILAIPYGRRNSDFVNIGEDDTMTVTNNVRAQYHVDPARVYLAGASMGGYGAYAIGLHQPDQWAAVTVMSGRTDFYLWFKLNRDEVPVWKRLQYDADDPRHLKLNALQLPFYIQHGALDVIVDPEHSRRFNADLQALGYAVRYREIADSDHYLYWQDQPYESAFDWLSRLRHVGPPRHVIYTTGSLHDHLAYWVDIEALTDYSRLAQIDAQVQPGNVITVKANNIHRFRLTPPASILEPQRPITLKVNGVLSPDKFDPTKPVEWRDGTPEPTPATLLKSPAVCGPIKNCYRAAFLLVYGTLQKGVLTNAPANLPAAPNAPLSPNPFPPDAPALPDANEQVPPPLNLGSANPLAANVTGATADSIPFTGNPDEDNARRFAREWDRYADGTLPLKADTEVTEADRKNYNLVLFGTRQSNSILAQIADGLPVELTPTGYRLGTKQYPMPGATNLGAQLCYPSPFAAQRMIVVQSGVFWGSALPINHKFDLLPDYIVYDGTFDPTDSTNHTLAAGYFNGSWQLTNMAPEPVAPGVVGAL